MVSTMGSATAQHYNVSYMLWRGGCCVGIATCSIFWVWRLFPGPSQWSLLPIVSSWRRTVGFFGTNAFKVPCWVRASGPSGAVGPWLGRQPEDTNPGQMRLPHPNVGRVKASWFKLVQRVCLPSRELTYPPKMAYMAFWRWCSFSPGGIC